MSCRRVAFEAASDRAIYTEPGRLWQAAFGAMWRYWPGSGPCTAAKEMRALRVSGAVGKVMGRKVDCGTCTVSYDQASSPADVRYFEPPRIFNGYIDSSIARVSPLK